MKHNRFDSVFEFGRLQLSKVVVHSVNTDKYLLCVVFDSALFLGAIFHEHGPCPFHRPGEIFVKRNSLV